MEEGKMKTKNLTQHQKNILECMQDGWSVFINPHNVMMSKGKEVKYMQSRTFQTLLNAGLIYQHDLQYYVN